MAVYNCTTVADLKNFLETIPNDFKIKIAIDDVGCSSVEGYVDYVNGGADYEEKYITINGILDKK